VCCQFVAGQNRDILIPFLMNRWLATAHICVVHHVVMDQREIVEKLDGDRGIESRTRVASDCFACQQNQDRADALAPRAQDILDRFVHKPWLCEFPEDGKPTLDARLVPFRYCRVIPFS
jgi:hypothetical protein